MAVNTEDGEDKRRKSQNNRVCNNANRLLQQNSRVYNNP